ncbi:MAG TPA: T9SS type A sorting domain-containing protein [Saprospiraceae bacterium]|nr:T9SS type A sorting domain-containing protein [Saprospiraceae bacterium]
MKTTLPFSVLQFAVYVLSQMMFATFVNAQAYPFIPYPDSSFNNSGSITLEDFIHFIPQEQAIQPDGKILVAGYGKSALNQDFDGILYRINSDGKVDLSFGTDGYLQIDIDGTEDAIESIGVLPDNKILILLESNHRIIFIRTLSDGTYDPDFGNEGVLLADTDPTEFGYDMQIQSDQKILMVGYQQVQANLNKGVVRRFNADGSPDTSFGTNGYVSVVIDPAINLELYDCTIQPDGKLIATGPYGSGNNSGFPIIRLNTDGSFDNTFSSDGKYLKILGTSVRDAVAYCIAVQSDGKIFVGGNAPTALESAMAVVSVNKNGGANGTFGNFGTKKIVITGFASANDIVIQPDGKLLLGGYCFLSQTTTGFVSARLETSGAVDTTYGLSSPQGVFVSFLSGEAFDVQILTNLDLQPDGRLVGMGWLNKTVNLNLDQPAKCVIFRSLMDILVETTEPNPVVHDVNIFPNPVTGELVTLEYELDKPQTISASLYDLNGTAVAKFCSNEYRMTGKNREQFYVSPDLPAGTYFVVLFGEDGIRTIKISKN